MPSRIELLKMFGMAKLVDFKEMISQTSVQENHNNLENISRSLLRA